MNVSIIGLGKLGVCMAAAMASKGHHVIGVDVNCETIKKVNEGKAPVVEPQLQDNLTANRDRIVATADYKDAIMNTDLSFVVVPTPSDDRGYFEIKYAQQAFRSIGEVLRKKKGFHTVVLTSTVLPGATRYGCLPELIKAANKSPGKDFGLCYSPEFIALGSVIKDFLHPDILLIGELNQASGSTLAKFYKSVVANKPAVKRMSIENAELAKIALNTYVTTKITYANVISAICEKVPGGDCDAVLDAVGADSRVGKKYLRAGLGYGGPCFPRDNIALSTFAKDVGVNANLMSSVDAVNGSVPTHIVDSVRKYLTGASRILVLGTSYKPGSPLTEESQAFALATILARDFPVPVDTWDPIAMCTLPKKPRYRDYSHIIIANNDPAFTDLAPETVDNGAVVIDLWRSHPAFKKAVHVRYVPLGQCRNDQIATMKLVGGIPYAGC